MEQLRIQIVSGRLEEPEPDVIRSLPVSMSLAAAEDVAAALCRADLTAIGYRILDLHDRTVRARMIKMAETS